VSLSDRERRLLAEMEAALATDDPRLQSRLGGSTLTPARPRVLLGVGLISKTTPIGALGFLIALAGVLTLIRSIAALGPSLPRTHGRGKSLGARLEERWDRRNM
jgi:hypothetical protein